MKASAAGHRRGGELGDVGLFELVQHLSIFDYVAVSGGLEGRMVEYVNHLHEHFVGPVSVRDGHYLAPTAPGYSAQMHAESLEAPRAPGRGGVAGRRQGLSHLSHLECARCGDVHDADVPQNLCECGSPLLARYDLEAVAGTVDLDEIAGREPTLWRYREMLLVRARENMVGLGEGMTPLLGLPRIGERIGLPAPADEGRGRDPHRQLQGAWGCRRRLARA